MALLEVNGLEVAFGPTRVLRSISFKLEAGETLGVVGESGCGKSQTGFAVIGMTPPPGKIVSGSIKFEGRELVGLKEREYQQIRGSQIALVMQDPFTSLNPTMRVGDQIAEALRLHQDLGQADAWKRSVEMLQKVGVPAPESSARRYPHQLSGGQRQRVVIAIAFACRPKILIADEPTTALDVTLQAQILRLLREMQSETGAAVMLISHDIGVIGSVAHRVAVFYAGKIVESGPVAEVLQHPQMPYTQALLNALPRVGADRLEAISGKPPEFASLPKGCSFSPRCKFRMDRCDEEPEMTEVSANHEVACWLAAQTAGRRR